MPELIQKVTSLNPAEIAVHEDRLRPVSDPVVLALTEVITDYGFTTPIIVRKEDDGWSLVDGLHRLTAMRMMGREEIPVRAYRCTKTEARALEASSNLAGASMSPLDDAIFLSTYRDIYLEKHPETRRGNAGAASRWDATELSSFAQIVADKRSVSTRQVRKIIAVGTALSKDERLQLRNARNPVTLSDLQTISKVSEPRERAAICSALSSGTAKNAGDARRQYAVSTGSKKAVETPSDASLLKLKDAWARAPKSARRGFVEDNRDLLLELLGVAE